MDNGLTPQQEDYFRTLEMLDPDGKMHDVIQDAKNDLRRRPTIVRGESRLRGFTSER
jgi:hypothetical protein